MITITILQDHEDAVGFHCIGHSGYAEAGSDIICAGGVGHVEYEPSVFCS